MSATNLGRLAAVIRSERGTLLSRWREQVRKLPSARHLDVPALNDRIPALLDDLAAAFESACGDNRELLLADSPPIHGRQRYEAEFDIVEVVAEYGILRACIYDLAEENGLSLCGDFFHILNRLFDEAIGLAVQTFATRQALAVQQLRDEHLAFFAHDLRSPLQAISIAAEVLESSYSGQADPADVSRMFGTLRCSVQTLRTLIQNAMSESGHVRNGIKLERREFELRSLVEAVMHDLFPVARTAGTEIVNEVAEGFMVYADASLLRRVLQNVFSNAMAYTARGEVVIGARPTGAHGGFECWVSDNGAGIPAERLKRIFDKHETNPERGDGAGLGLAIVKTFVEAHGGEVSIESELGKGSTVRFTLPGKTE
jgi:two-component system phosphate regulon sensor histidine kinase PhoR